VLVGDHHIAYQVFGSGPPDLLFLRTNMNNLEVQWDEPHFAAFLNGLGSFARVATYDDRGTGLSDPFEPGTYLNAVARMEDVLAVLDKVEMKEVVLVAESAATFRAVHLAASHPERVAALVLCGGYARMRFAPDYPLGFTDEESASLARDPNSVMYAGVSDELRDWFDRYRRLSINRGTLRTLNAHFSKQDDRDVREILPSLRVPCLVIEHTDMPKAGRGRDLADRIMGARYVPLPGRAFYGWHFPDPALVASTIEEFITGEKSAPRLDRVLATVVFTDVVASTNRAAEFGDRRWRETLDAFDAFAERQVARFGGRLVKATGDGHLATFDSPSRATLWACAMRDGVARFDLEIRAGVHLGEIELRGTDIGGMAVNIARRVCDVAPDGTVLVSGNVPPLVTGSGLEFDDRGEHELKGVPGRWQLYSVRS
jgi:class 3 adenylate cyclase